MLGQLKKPVVVSIFSQYQVSDDRNVFTQQYNNSEVFNAGIQSQYKFAQINTQLSGGGSFAQFSAGGKDFRTIGAQATLRKPFFNDKMKSNLSLNYTKRYSEGLLQGDILALNLGSQMKLGKHHSVGIQMRLMQNNTGIVSNASLNEQRASIQYGFTF
jgi:hypothetical protein